MTPSLGEYLGLSDDEERYLVRGLQLLLVGLVLYGVVTLQFRIAVNGSIALLVTLLPALLRREYDYAMDFGLVLWLTIAVLLHAVGSVGPYRWFSWYDEITHTLTATIVAGVGYAALRALELHSDEIDVPSAFRAVFIVVFVLAFGVLWEVMEFGVTSLSDMLNTKSPVIVFGIDDIVTDMIFNTVGAVLVAAAGTGYVRGFSWFLTDRLDDHEETES